MGVACSTHRRDEKYKQSSGRKPEGKRPSGRPRRRWEDNIRIDLREIEWKGYHERDQWRALLNTVINIRVE